MLNLKICGIIAGIAFFLSLLIGILSKASMPVLLMRPFIFALLFFLISLVVNVLANRFLPELLEEGLFETASGHFPGENAAGSRVDITEGGDFQSSFAGHAQAGGRNVLRPVFLGAQPDSSENGLGNINELYKMNQAPKFSDTGAQAAQPGMDQIAQDDYTEEGASGDFFKDDVLMDIGFGASAAEASSAGEQVSAGKQDVSDTPGIFTDFFGAEDTLPDLDSMAGAFASATPLDVEQESDDTGYSSSPRKPLSTSSKTPAIAGDFNPKELAKGIQTALNKDKEG
jgi:hypothetical protein